MIRANANKYPIYKMCKILGISQSSYYTYKEKTKKKDVLCEKIITALLKAAGKALGGTEK